MNIHAPTPGRRPLSRLLPYTFVLAAVGCTTHHGTRLNHAQSERNEHSRALTTGVVDILQSQPDARRDLHTATALELAREDQRLEGFPALPLDIHSLLAANRSANTNGGQPAEAAPSRVILDPATASRFQQAEKALSKERAEESALLVLGARAEAAKQRRVGLLAKLAAVLGIPLGAVILAVILFPALLPVAGRALAWLVGRMPWLASALGVVSVKAFDAVVRGVEETRKAAQMDGATRDLANSRPTTPTQSLLEINLSRAMDQAHKRLVRSRRSTLGAN